MPSVKSSVVPAPFRYKLVDPSVKLSVVCPLNRVVLFMLNTPVPLSYSIGSTLLSAALIAASETAEDVPTTILLVLVETLTVSVVVLTFTTGLLTDSVTLVAI